MFEVNNNEVRGHQIIQSEEEEKLARLSALTKQQDHVIVSTSNISSSIKAQNKFKEENSLLDWFGTRFKDERKFSKHKHSKYFSEIFENILKNRVSNPEFTEKTSFENALRYFICVRLVTRDLCYQKEFIHMNGVDCLAKQLTNVTDNYLTHCEDYYLVDILNNICSILLKITKSNRDVLISQNVHVELIKLLHSSDTFILHCVLLILIELSESPVICSLIHDLQKVDFVVRIIREFDESSRIKASEFLLKLCENRDIREQLVIFDCLPVLLSVLHDGCHCVLLRNIVWILVLLCKDSQHMKEIRHLGGIPLLLTLLQDDRSFTVDRHQVSSANMRTGRSKHVLTARNNSGGDGTNTQELFENVIQLKIACCTALSELGLDDHNTETIVEGNGIYKIAKLILPQSEIDVGCKNSILHLQRTAFRALRFLFSMERNRRLFKRLFPTDMYRMFIDIGHYVRDQNKYSPLVEALNSLDEDELEGIKYGIEELNENKTPRRIVKGQYAVIDILGSGAFGTVYKVKKENEEKPLALKEVSVFIGGMGDVKGGKNKQKKRDLEEVVQELTIIKEQLRHPNIVRYYRTFQDSDKLYIEMQLIEGASLQEHFVSLEEKGEKGIGETRIWRVFIQMCLALRYLHIEKKIVHRDLTPNNVMLGENDHVTITDFGLAKQKQKESKLYSVVGTLVYSCPEIIKSEPYGEKADIWAIGCILYQMATLKPPFPADNMLSLANKIVEAKFDPISDKGEYSSSINYTVTKCLTVNPDDRPDIIGVVGLIAAQMLSYTDRVTALYNSCQRRLEKEWRHTQRNYHEAKRNKQDFRSLLQANQDRLSLSNLSFTQAERVTSFNPSVSSPATLTATTPPNGYKLSPGETTSPTSDVFSNSSSSTSSIPDSLTDYRRPFPPRSRPNSGKEAIVTRPGIPCRALSFDLSEQHVVRDNLLSRGCPSARGRPLSASNASTLTISPRKVRQINDPAQTMLHQLHKIIYIDQLPPTTEVNFMRKMISRYKRALFSSQSTSVNLKTELKKLMSGSNDHIGASLSTDTSSLARKAAAEVEAKELPGNGVLSVSTSPSSVSEEGLTYSKMYNMIEKVLCEIGYYDMSSTAVMKSRDFNYVKPFHKQKT